MLERFRQYIDKQHFFPDGGEVLLAVSGGRDSVALADLMHRCGIPFAIAHSNFHLRPGECDRDQRFVQQMADRLSVRFFTIDFDTTAHAAAHGLSVEEAARELRYSWFARLCDEKGFCCLATAHHRDDSIETFFLNLFRGTGIAGLHGIRPISSLGTMTVVRPLLCFSRVEIDEYIAERGLEYVEDSTNAELDARRNRIRLQLMPLLRELYPSVDATMEANIERLTDAGKVFDAYVADLRGRLVQPYQSRLATMQVPIQAISVEEIQSLDPQRTLLFELLKPYGFNAPTVDDILQTIALGHTGRQFLSPTHVAELHRGNLLIAHISKPIAPSLEFNTANGKLQTTNNQLSENFDADLPHQPLAVRLWREGDRFCPLGMDGSRLVSDFMKDCGLSLIERRQVHLLVDVDDRPLWVIGLRIDNRFRLTPSTTHVLRAQCGR